MTEGLRPEYDLRSLEVRGLGPERTAFGGNTVRLEPDVAAVFQDAGAVNEALRFLIRLARQVSPAQPTGSTRP
jgi:hypothetical protein